MRSRARWYRLKARLLGVERLADYDRMAAVTEDEVEFPYAQAREIVLDCYGSFSPELGRLAGRFFAEHHIDAPVRPAKRGGAFCAAAVPSVFPYVLLNYTFRRRDVLTLAHELGHGVHFALAAAAGHLPPEHTPLTLAETASVFGETIVFGRLLAEDNSPASRLALLAENLEDTIATVFRQVAMNRFEELVHTARREQGELSVERIGELWAREPGRVLRRLGRADRGLSSAGGPTSRTSSPRPATCTRTPTGSCWRCRCTSATSSSAQEIVPQLPGAARRRRLAQPRGARADRRRGPRRPRLLGRGPGPRRAPARAGRSRPPATRVARRRRPRGEPSQGSEQPPSAPPATWPTSSNSGWGITPKKIVAAPREQRHQQHLGLGSSALRASLVGAPGGLLVELRRAAREHRQRAPGGVWLGRASPAAAGASRIHIAAITGR